MEITAGQEALEHLRFDGAGYESANASYDIGERFSIFVEGLNLSNERSHEFSIYEERLIELKDTGRRYSIGARMDF